MDGVIKSIFRWLSQIYEEATQNFLKKSYKITLRTLSFNSWMWPEKFASI